jgi:hypothetical protein
MMQFMWDKMLKGSKDLSADLKEAGHAAFFEPEKYDPKAPVRAAQMAMGRMPFAGRGQAGVGGGRLLQPKALEGEIMAQPPAKAGASSATSRRLGIRHAAEIDPETGMTYAEKAHRASLGPMWGRLEKLGMSYPDIMNIELKDAYKFIKDRNVK